jgi:predicted esterase
MKFKISTFIFGISILSLTNLFAQPSIVAKFEARSHTFQSTTLPYRLFVPDNYNPAQKYPLVLALHGSDGQGTDNINHMGRGHRFATSWADPVNQASYPSFVVAPQVPFDASWFGVILTTANDILDSLINEFSIDINRLYITGLSLGGFGTWEMIERYPDRFAAAIPMSGGGNPTNASTIAHIPIWNFHGALDDLVSVSLSRQMIIALEQAGETAVYTHCKTSNCTGLPDSVIAMFVESHANLLYTEYENGGHFIYVDPLVASLQSPASYDHPLLFPWVFSKYKMTDNAIVLSDFGNHRILSGIETLNSQDSVEIWYSPDAGGNWQLVSRSEPNSGTYEWNTEEMVDCSFGLLKVFVKNAEGFIYGRDQSSFFTIDNSVNGKPFVKILNQEFDSGAILDQNSFELELLIGDSETDPLNLILNYSSDGGKVFSQFDSYTTFTDTVSQFRAIDMAPLPNSSRAVIRVEVNDDNTFSFDKTYRFLKNTPRLSGPRADHTLGRGGIVTVSIIDPDQLTGSLYRITFDDTTLDHKVYDVLNVDTGEKVVENATQLLDGVSEGPFFDGLSLLIKDFESVVVDQENTGWSIGSSTLEISISLPSIDLGNEVLEGFPHPADYMISISDQVVDTSSTTFGAAAIPMMFKVWNVTEDKKADVIFIETDNNQTLSLFDEIFILEPGPDGKLRLTWSIAFFGTQNDNPPVPGDEFVFRTLEPLSSEDVYEFQTIATSVRGNSPLIPRVLTLFQNYPNPFNPSTTIHYYLPKAEHVEISVYNLLGQKVVSLLEGKQATGMHSLTWDGRSRHGNMVGSGVYFYKIATDSQSIIKKMILIR